MATCTDCSGVCSLWVNPEDIDCPGNQEDYDTALEEAAQVASDWLYMASGRRFPGCCQTTVWPCSQQVMRDFDPAGVQRELPNGSVSGRWHGCGCGSRGDCSCSGAHEVHLGLEPVRDIVTVTIDGVVVDPTLYQVVDYSMLMRVDGETWPCCNDTFLTDGEGAWSVEFTYGRQPPAMGVAAAKVLACEVTKFLTGGDADCELPSNVTSVVRLGVTQEFGEVTQQQGPNGWLTGLWLPDRFINAYNPAGLSREGGVYSPDIGRGARVVTS